MLSWIEGSGRISDRRSAAGRPPQLPTPMQIWFGHVSLQSRNPTPLGFQVDRAQCKLMNEPYSVTLELRRDLVGRTEGRQILTEVLARLVEATRVRAVPIASVILPTANMA